MTITRTETGARHALSFLPDRLADEIVRISSGRVGGVGEIREIRVRCVMRSSFLHGSQCVPLLYAVTEEEMGNIVNKMCDGSLYAHHDSITKGYIPLSYGVRVGVGGEARYEYNSLVGIARARSLVFRIPGHECSFSKELYEAFSGVERGMLVYSPPGVGKTTALRALAKGISSGKDARRVCVVDERLEFCDEDYVGCEVDILKGYKRRLGLEIATRTMSPEVIMIDEIGADDTEAIKDTLRCGVPVIATAHASSIEDLKSRSGLASLLSAGVFDVLVGIERQGGKYHLHSERYD